MTLPDPAITSILWPNPLFSGMISHRIIFFLALALAQPVAAQAPTRNVPIDHWTMPRVEHLIRSGAMVDPDPLTRPLTRRQLTRALLDVDTISLNNAARALVADLIREFSDPTGDPAYHFEGYLGFRAKTHGRRQPLRTGGVGLGSPIGAYDASATFGNFLLNSHGLFDRQLREDPEFTGIFPGIIPNRVLGNISYQFEHGEAFFGSLSRNWGPAAVDGLQISSVPYSYDHFGLRLNNKHLTFDMLATSLDVVPDQNGVPNNRYLMAHRITLRAVPRLTLSFTETTIIVGEGRKFEIWFLNPLRLSWLAADDQADKGKVNFIWSMDVHLRLGDHSAAFGSYMIDDGPGVFDFRPNQGIFDEPGSWAITVGGRTSLPGGGGVTASYTAVSLLTFRTSNGNPAEVYAIRGVGLARNFSDYDQLTIEASFLPHSSTIIRPEITLLRQGEGDFRQPFPPPEVWEGLPFLHLGIVERTWRFAVAGTTNLNSRALIDWNGGLHLVSNVQNVAGVSDNFFVGSVSVRVFGDLDDFWWWLPWEW